MGIGLKPDFTVKNTGEASTFDVKLSAAFAAKGWNPATVKAALYKGVVTVVLETPEGETQLLHFENPRIEQYNATEDGVWYVRPMPDDTYELRFYQLEG